MMINWCENRYCGMDSYYMYFFVNGCYRAVKHSDVIAVGDYEQNVRDFSEEVKKTGGAKPD